MSDSYQSQNSLRNANGSASTEFNAVDRISSHFLDKLRNNFSNKCIQQSIKLRQRSQRWVTGHNGFMQTVNEIRLATHWLGLLFVGLDQFNKIDITSKHINQGSSCLAYTDEQVQTNRMNIIDLHSIVITIVRKMRTKIKLHKKSTHSHHPFNLPIACTKTPNQLFFQTKSVLRKKNIFCITKITPEHVYLKAIFNFVATASHQRTCNQKICFECFYW